MARPEEILLKRIESTVKCMFPFVLHEAFPRFSPERPSVEEVLLADGPV